MITDTLKLVLDDKGRAVRTVEPEESVLAAVRTMNEHGIGAMLVMENGQTVGIFTERDVLRRVVAAGRDPAGTPVRDVMTKKIVCVSPSTTVEESMAIVTELRCRHLPVLEDGRVHGLVSIGDLTRWVTRG